jgi:serine/threonine-protein kinase
MSASALPSLPIEDALHVERLCTRFELSWQQGERPRAETYRAEVSAAVWPVLLRELLALEMAFRLRDQDRATAPDETTSVGPATVTDSRAEEIPTRFGDYEEVVPISHGAQGVVCKAWNRKLKRPEALKFPSGPVSARDLERFRFEGEAAAALKHPHIVSVYHVDQVGGRPYLAMEWVEGGTLAAPLREPKRNLPALVRQIAAAARAVQHAHERGILHRDLKPANILLDAEGQAHVTDFGLARRLDAPSEGDVAGTPAYMAPEQARGDHFLTPAADVYGLGAILYEALTGRPPYQGTIGEVLRQVCEQAPPAPCSLEPGIDPNLEAVCLRCLEREPAARYASASALADDLEHWLRGEPVSARPPGMWEWLRQEWRNRPPPFTYSWQSAIWMGLATLASSAVIFALVRLDVSVLWVWAVLLLNVVGEWRILRRHLMKRFRQIAIAERQSLMITVGNLAASLILFAVTLPWRPSASAREILPVYPPLTLLTGMTLFVIGSTHWGRLFPIGLALMALAPLLAWLPEWAPLLYGSATAVCLWWWAWCVRRYFGPASERKAGRT